jgi:hypothetical protein
MRLVAQWITLFNESCGRGLQVLLLFLVLILTVTINIFIFVNLHKVSQMMLMMCTESIFFASYWSANLKIVCQLME